MGPIGFDPFGFQTVLIQGGIFGLLLGTCGAALQIPGTLGKLGGIQFCEGGLCLFRGLEASIHANQGPFQVFDPQELRNR